LLELTGFTCNKLQIPTIKYQTNPNDPNSKFETTDLGLSAPKFGPEYLKESSSALSSLPIGSPQAKKLIQTLALTTFS